MLGMAMYSYYVVPLLSIESNFLLRCRRVCRVNSSAIDERFSLCNRDGYHTGPCLSATACVEGKPVTVAIVNVND
jgi:hypothetical protein